MKYVEVAVNAPGGHLHSFSYSVPTVMEVEAGQAVWVPFGSKTVQGIVISVSDSPAYPETRDINGIIFPRPMISAERIELATWIASYYLSPLFHAVELMLPPGFQRKAITRVRLIRSDHPLKLDDVLHECIDYIKCNGGNVLHTELVKKYGAKQAASYIKELTGKGILEKYYDIQAEKIKSRMVNCIELNCTAQEALDLAAELRSAKLNSRADILELLAGYDAKAELSMLRRNKTVKASALKKLIQEGVLSVSSSEVKRDPLAKRILPLELPMVFTEEQQSAWERIGQAINYPKGEQQSKVFLLHGITGSGKTEIYLKALGETIKLGKKGIFLVPEIALTPQMIERVYARFPGRVAVLHSKLTMGQQYDQWQGISKGEYDVVIGSRSAVFAPQPDLGLIIVDEEHEWAYKQSEPVPRYHARDVAIKLAELCNAVVILGSATPDVQTYHKGQTGEYSVLELKSRAGLGNVPQLPEISIVDMKVELKSGHRGLFSRLLQAEMATTLQQGGQVILYINRRGQSTYVKCADCGYVIVCNRCSVPLTYHSSNRRLICHHCNRAFNLPSFCPECQSHEIKYLGTGTERVEDECASLFPGARVIRFDSDAVEGAKDYEKVVNRFKQREADILIGTQMVAKGLNFPYVMLVGVVNADIGLTLPDFRSAERIFQLLCQVSGRAGRGTLSGRAVIQTYNPVHYAIKYVANNDYAGFYQHEINYRREFGYPPFSQMLRIVYNHSSRQISLKAAESMLNTIKTRMEEKGFVNLRIIGPAPAHTARLRGKYLTQIIIFGRELHTLVQAMRFPPGWTLDIDPVGVV